MLVGKEMAVDAGRVNASDRHLALSSDREDPGWTDLGIDAIPSG